jgi:hypothetical protein
MTSLTVEEQKEKYSRELAAHTLRQWNAVRGSLNGMKKSAIDSSSPMSTPEEFDNSQADRDSKAQTPLNSNSEYHFYMSRGIRYPTYIHRRPGRRFCSHSVKVK